MLGIQLQLEEVKLLPEKALYWPARKTIIVSDLHWGKTAHFRKHGIAIPIGAQHGDEVRLSNLVQGYGVERLIVAGDLFHSVTNKQVDGFAHWRQQHKELHLDLVLGNHDILPSEKYSEHNIALHPEFMDAGPFIISHDKLVDPDKFHIHGHLHPCFTANGRGRMSIRTQCFCIDDNRMVLPSFGSFTGCHNINAVDFRQIYLIANDEVIRWQ